MSDPYMRIVMVFDTNETAGRFLREDGEGGFAAGVSRMADSIDKLTAALEPLKSGIDSSTWHDVQGERMKRVLVAETAIARIEEALSAALKGSE